MVYFKKDYQRLIIAFDGETMWVEPWGPDALRIRSTKEPVMPTEDWAILSDSKGSSGEIDICGESATVSNGNIIAKINRYGRMEIIHKNGSPLLREYWRYRVDNEPDNHDEGHGGTDVLPGVGCATQIAGRQFRAILGGYYEITARFESNPNEKLFGMGQYQQPYLNMKNTVLEMAQRNSQATVPFVLSDDGYGFLWNNPSVGKVEFCKNMTVWSATCSDILDYWVCAGDTPADIIHSYAKVTGTVPMMPDWGMGFWQCKLRYRTQEELLRVAREYKRRHLPIDVIVVDYFHWPLLGDWKWEDTYWPDPAGMVQELKEMGIELMVSVWPMVDYRSEHYKEMKAQGYLLRNDRGFRLTTNFVGNSVATDCFNPGARAYLWDKIKESYYSKGIRLFWLDEAEPEFDEYDFDIVRNFKGPHMKNGNFYPVEYAKTFYDGLREEGHEDIINLLRCAWAGSQRYGALVWSGDIYSSFESLRAQISAGISMGIAGIPWWTTDIGGFFGGDADSADFRELFARWFAFGAFCPVMRLHGNRMPSLPPQGDTVSAQCLSGSDNEVWSFGEENYRICRKYLEIRQRMKPYIKQLMEEAHRDGSPIMRALFYEFPEDKHCWDVEDSYCFGPNILVAPVTEAGAIRRNVYLPAGATWKNAWSGKIFEGGQEVIVEAPVDLIPVFLRDDFAMDFHTAEE